MDQKLWINRSEELALRVWIIECADVMISPDEARRRWDAMPTGSSRRIELTHLMGCALIALEDMNLVAQQSV
jgi:hypothetical protein